MSFNGSGTFSINTPGQPVVTGTTISSTAFNALTADLASGLSSCITKDGQTTPTANIAMGNNRITMLGAAVARTDAVQYAQVQNSAPILLGSVSGTNTVTATLNPTLTAYVSGQVFTLVPANTSTGPVTINIDGLGAKNVFSGGAGLNVGELRQNVPVSVEFDGTQFNLLGGGGRGTFTPSLTFGGGSTGIVYALQSGIYRLQGGECKFSLRVALTNKGSSTGNMLILGLPFSSSSAVHQAVTIGSFSNISSGITQALMAVVLSGTTAIQVGYGLTGQTQVFGTSDTSNTTDLIVSGSYLV